MQLIDMRAAMRTVTSGREAYLRNFPAMRELGFVNLAVEPLAVRGDRWRCSASCTRGTISKPADSP